MRVQEVLRYVSRGGLKLEAALDAFGIDPTGWVCADIGASTGGFTDCLLSRGRSVSMPWMWDTGSWPVVAHRSTRAFHRANEHPLSGLTAGTGRAW